MDKFLFAKLKGWRYNIHFHRTAVTIELQRKIGWFRWETLDSDYCDTSLVHATITSMDDRNAWRLGHVQPPEH